MGISHLYNDESIPSDKEKGINNMEFDRECTKFFVSHENVFQVIGIIIQHLPIYVYGKKRSHKQVYQKINSVYFDNDDFKSYHERIQKQEGARVFRIRWYDQLEPTKDTDTVFMERKLHHKTSNDVGPSLKQRFKLNNDKVLPFLNGTYTKNSNKNIQNEIFQFVNTFNLKPKTRTVCKRISFQFNDNNDLRISLDLNLAFIKEESDLLSNNSWFTPSERVYDENVVQFNFDILEIKLSGNAVNNAPQWIQDLMASDLLLDCYKFSKYGQSINEFYQNKVSVIPKWIENSDEIMSRSNNIIINNTMPTTTNSNHVIVNIANNEQHNVDDINPFDEFGEFEDDDTTNQQQDGCWKNVQKNNKKKKEKKKDINPKVYFSNERTFLGWFQAAVFIGGAGLTIHSINRQDPAAYLLLSAAFIVLLWAICLYYIRNYKLLKGTTTGLHDVYGPALLVLLILFVFGYSVITGTNQF